MRLRQHPCDNALARDRIAVATELLFGPALAARFWRLYEEVRDAVGFVDFLETLRRFRSEHPEVAEEPLARTILDFPYAEVRFPGVLEVIASLRAAVRVVVLSDGDPVFQALKIARSGVAAAVGGDVLVFEHKDEHLDDVARLFPAHRYIAVDDKAGVLARIKRRWGALVGTVHVRQGKYAGDTYEGPPPDATIERIADLSGLLGTAAALEVFLAEASARGRSSGTLEARRRMR